MGMLLRRRAATEDEAPKPTEKTPAKRKPRKAAGDDHDLI